MINLQHHQHDFNISASWTFSASRQGKGPCDGIGGVVKSGANRSILLSDTVISCAEDFLNFTKKFNGDAAKLSQTNEPPINICYLKRNDIERVTEDLLTERWNKNKSKSFLLSQQTLLYFCRLGRITGIRMFHQFDPQNDGAILCRKTSNSINTFAFHLLKKSEKGIKIAFSATTEYFYIFLS